MTARVLFLGASGLIGGTLARGLAQDAEVVALARGPVHAMPSAVEVVRSDIVALDEAALRDLLAEIAPTMIVNAIGALQDGPGGSVAEVHERFVSRLVAAAGDLPKPPSLVLVSMTGDSKSDGTAFSATKRLGERHVEDASLRTAILRPGFVIAGGAYGGSALLRTLAAYPVGLPADLRSRPFMAVAASDIVRTVRWLIAHDDWQRIDWTLVARERTTLDDVLAAHRDWIDGPKPWFAMPGPLMTIGAKLSDWVGSLGWKPPTRSTAITELRRGVEGDPEAWIAATGIEPLDADEALHERPATVADRWFARLYPLKASAIATLAAFWTVSGLIAFASYGEARAILVAAGFGEASSHFVTATSSLMDIVIGALIAVRRTARTGLWLGVAMSLFYMAGAAVLTPAMWLEPLGALVKTFPAIVLMLICLATLDDR